MAAKVWVGGSEIRPIRAPKYRGKAARRDNSGEYGSRASYGASTEATILMPGGSFDIDEFPALKSAVERARKAS